MFSWVHEIVAVHSPILNINSAQPESGKSTALGLVSFLAPRCICVLTAAPIDTETAYLRSALRDPKRGG
jgi:hypothetical protein